MVPKEEKCSVLRNAAIGSQSLLDVPTSLALEMKKLFCNTRRETWEDNSGKAFR